VTYDGFYDMRKVKDEIAKEQFTMIAKDILDAFENDIFSDMKTDPFVLKFATGSEDQEKHERVLLFLNAKYKDFLRAEAVWWESRASLSFRFANAKIEEALTHAVADFLKQRMERQSQQQTIDDLKTMVQKQQEELDEYVYTTTAGTVYDPNISGETYSSSTSGFPTEEMKRNIRELQKREDAQRIEADQSLRNRMLKMIQDEVEKRSKAWKK
jgi:hypothetical protein